MRNLMKKYDKVNETQKAQEKLCLYLYITR